MTRRPDLDSPWWWAAALGCTLILALQLAAWLMAALVVLPVMAYGRIRHDRQLVARMARILGWQVR